MLSIYDYEDSVDFISDYIKDRKKEDDTFSVSNWSKSMGFNSSAPVLDVLKRRKKLKGKTLEAVTKGLAVDRAERVYFQLLAEKDSFASEDRRNLYNLLIKEVSPKYKEGYSCLRFEESAGVFSHWIYMALLTSTRLKDFHLTAEAFVDLIQFDVDKSFVEKAILELISLKLLSKNEQGDLVATHSAHSTKTDGKSPDVRNYFNMVCELAKKSLDMDSEEREIQCLSLALPKSQLSLAKEIIRKCRHQLESLVDEEKNDSVYQVNLVMFPLSK